MTDNKIGPPEGGAPSNSEQSANELGTLPQSAQVNLPQSLINIDYSLSKDETFNNPGVVKLLIDDLQSSRAKCADLEKYKESYHDADKKAAVFEERLKSSTAFDTLFGVMIGLGGTILGISPALWPYKPYGLISLSVGSGLAIVAIILKWREATKQTKK